MTAAMFFVGVFLGCGLGISATRQLYKEKLKHMTHWKDYWETEAQRVNVILYENLGIDTGATDDD